MVSEARSREEVYWYYGNMQFFLSKHVCFPKDRKLPIQTREILRSIGRQCRSNNGHLNFVALAAHDLLAATPPQPTPLRPRFPPLPYLPLQGVLRVGEGISRHTCAASAPRVCNSLAGLRQTMNTLRSCAIPFGITFTNRETFRVDTVFIFV